MRQRKDTCTSHDIALLVPVGTILLHCERGRKNPRVACGHIPNKRVLEPPCGHIPNKRVLKPVCVTRGHIPCCAIAQRNKEVDERNGGTSVSFGGLDSSDEFAVSQATLGPQASDASLKKKRPCDVVLNPRLAKAKLTCYEVTRASFGVLSEQRNADAY